MAENLTDDSVEKVGQFIKAHQLQTRDYTFGEVYQTLVRWTDEPRNEQDFAKLKDEDIDRLFGKYGKGSLIDSQERQQSHTA